MSLPLFVTVALAAIGVRGTIEAFEEFTADHCFTVFVSGGKEVFFVIGFGI